MGSKPKPLVLVIDVDDDIAEVLGKSVIVGEDEVRDAILRYGIERPEDSDVNAMLAGLNLYNKLGGRGNAEIAVVGGHSVDFIEAQRLIKERVKGIVDKLSGDVELYLVSDGEDELLLSEVLRDIAPVSGMKRVVIEQHLGIEGSYILLFRYIKKAMFDPRFSKYFLGIPGFALLVFSVLSLIGLLDVAVKLALAILGASMIVRGFDLEAHVNKMLYDVLAFLRTGHPLKIAGATVLLVTIAGSLIISGLTLSGAETLYERVYLVLKYPLVSIGIGLIGYLLLARLLYKVVNGDFSIARELSLIVLIAGISAGFYSLGDYLSLKEGAALDSGVLATSFLESGFIPYIIVSSGLAAIIEALGRTLTR